MNNNKGKGVCDEDDADHQPISDEEFARRLQEGGESEIEGAWVEPLSTCPHVSHCLSFGGHLASFDALCESCGDGKENWVCLSCNKVLCGRYRGAHMLEHIESSGHHFAMGFRDLSVWCFPCSSYLDAEVIPILKPYHEALHIMKFGELAPRAIPTLKSFPGE